MERRRSISLNISTIVFNKLTISVRNLSTVNKREIRSLMKIVDTRTNTVYKSLFVPFMTGYWVTIFCALLSQINQWLNWQLTWTSVDQGGLYLAKDSSVYVILWQIWKLKTVSSYCYVHPFGVLVRKRKRKRNKTWHNITTSQGEMERASSFYVTFCLTWDVVPTVIRLLHNVTLTFFWVLLAICSLDCFPVQITPAPSEEPQSWTWRQMNFEGMGNLIIINVMVINFE